ncbi:MAG: crossover junction endodeoxyribonuclease RuvC [Firmicutes bacterium]|nr:crossover junction endodeoxyribonuclease RuvC [Bacillota bacterium]MDD4263666.1 crossover junction endodeoxyribonuclease RuvC [Bacillota bacterium]MDD4693974.1 crossover junction endodeoxyribonuclease RuvC [Bacillota bacterium]
MVKNILKNKIVLGIDPGTALCGYGIVEEDQNGFRALSYGCIETSKEEPMPNRLDTIFQTLTELVKLYKPSAMSIERLFFNKNVTTAISVGQARGVCLLVAAQNQLEVFEYTPAEVKLSLTGSGKAVKRQVGFMVSSLLKLEEVPKPDDTSDALAMALCHYFHCNPIYDEISRF